MFCQHFEEKSIGFGISFRSIAIYDRHRLIVQSQKKTFFFWNIDKINDKINFVYLFQYTAKQNEEFRNESTNNSFCVLPNNILAYGHRLSHERLRGHRWHIIFIYISLSAQLRELALTNFRIFDTIKSLYCVCANPINLH